MMGGHQGLGSKFRGKGEGMDENPEGGEEDVCGVEGVVGCQCLVFRRLQHQGKGRGWYGWGWCRWCW